MDAGGAIRKPWLNLVNSLKKSTVEELRQREEQLRRIIRDNGITYNVYDDPDGANRPWMMDLLPVVFEHSEWQWLENALAQRVFLLNYILQDAYGRQNLLEYGVLPPSLVLGNPGFLRPLHGHQPRKGRFIHVYAADLARSPDGRWWVLADRVEASSGIGYAMENRFISGRVMPDHFRRAGVQRLSPFFEKFNESFAALAPRNKDNPRIVYLTPGPANETYFEQSFLARNLGYPLVEGADLTVRNNQVYLKTISGIQPVDVIIRRVDSVYCDPLELRDDSLLGIPGLVNAVRLGNVAIANALGAGLCETPALMAFLPNLSKRVLGESLKLPSVATWWCGQESELNYVLEHLKDLVVKPTFFGSNQPSLFGPLMSTAELSNARDLIRKQPSMWCAQELVAQATTPVMSAAGLEPRNFLLRVFMVAANGTYTLMPGGLTRIAAGDHPYSVSMQQGGGSKDTWVLAPKDVKAEEPAPLAHMMGTVQIHRAAPDLPSRVADNLYWLGRYMERAENHARISRLLLNTVAEEIEVTSLTQLMPILQTLISDERYEQFIAKADGEHSFDDWDRLLAEAIGDKDNPGSLESLIRHVQRTAGSVKERLSNDTWQMLGRFQSLSTRGNMRKNGVDLFSLVDETLIVLAGISGLAMENMTRGYGWIFLDLGRRMERGVNLCTLMRGCLEREVPNMDSVLYKLLICADSTITYRRRYLTQITMAPVLDLLIFDPANPRSVQFQVDQLRAHIEELPHRRSDSPPTAIDRLAIKLFSNLGLNDARELTAKDSTGLHAKLDAFLYELVEDFYGLSEYLAQHYFAHAKSALSTHSLQKP